MASSRYIDDLTAWVEWGFELPGIDQVHLLGHSEGALFAKAAASNSSVASVISLAGAGRPAGQLLLEQTEGRRPGQIGEQFEFILGELEAGRQVEDVPPMLNALFRPSVQPYLIEWLAMDPALIAASLDTPLLVIGGSTDLQARRADFDVLSAHTDQAIWIEGMNHVLKSAEGPIEQQLSVYMDPELALHEELVGVVVGFFTSLRHSGNPTL